MRLEEIDLHHDALDPFIELPYRLHAGDPGWIPPLREETRRLLGPANPFLQAGDLRCFLVRDGDRPVARAAATVNRRHRHEGRQVGAIGFFESERSYEAAELVLSAACRWLRAQGAETIWGPMNFGIFHAYRFMTRGFETTPFFGEPRNPSYYPEMFTRFGFRPLGRYYSWDLSSTHLAMIGLGARMMADPRLLEEGYRVDRLRTGEGFEEDLRRIHALLAEGFRENLGGYEIPFEEFAALFAGLRPFLVEDLVVIGVAPSGEDVGLGFVLPDLAPLFRAADGHAARVAEAAPGVRLDRVVLHTIAVRKPYRKKRIVETFLGPVVEKMLAAGFTSGVGALAKEGPTIYDKVGPPTREYTLYELAP